MISDSLAVPLNDPCSPQSPDCVDVGSSKHRPAMDGPTVTFMYPQVERIGWAKSIELEVRGKLRQMERGAIWHPIVHTSSHPNPSSSHSRIRLPPPNPTPRLPPEILELVLRSIRPGIDTIHDYISLRSFIEVFDQEEDSIGTIATCCRVCRGWVALCQGLLFSWVILRKSAQLDSLLHLHRASRLSHISPLIRRISVSYGKPNDKLGEALPRIATMAPPNLLRIDVAPRLDGGYDRLDFPFHDSLPLRLAPLHYVRILDLHWLKFTNFSEFRQLISCFSGLQALYFDFEQEWNSEVPRALHRMANPLLTRICGWQYASSLWPWLSPHSSGTSRQSRCNTAQISRTVPSVSAAIVTITHTIIERMDSMFSSNFYTLNVEWKWEKCRCVGQSQWSLNIHLVPDNPYEDHAPILCAVLLEFQPQTNLSHPSFDLPHIIEARTTIHHFYGHTLYQMDTISTMWKHDELIHLDNLERLQIGIHLHDDNPFDKPQMELMDYLKEHAKEYEIASDTLDGLQRRFETLRDSDRRYELEITVDGSPIDDVLREWKEKVAAVENEEGVADAGEGTETTKGPGEDEQTQGVNSS